MKSLLLQCSIVVHICTVINLCLYLYFDMNGYDPTYINNPDNDMGNTMYVITHAQYERGSL